MCFSSRAAQLRPHNSSPDDSVGTYGATRRSPRSHRVLRYRKPLARPSGGNRQHRLFRGRSWRAPMSVSLQSAMALRTSWILGSGQRPPSRATAMYHARFRGCREVRYEPSHVLRVKRALIPDNPAGGGDGSAPAFYGAHRLPPSCIEATSACARAESTWVKMAAC